MRPHFLVWIAVLVAVPSIVTAAIRGAARVGEFGSWVTVAMVIGICGSFVAALTLERIEVDERSVRVTRVFTADSLERVDIVAVHKSGGRGRPAFIELRKTVETNSRYLDLTWRPAVRRTVGATAFPSMLTTKQVANALDVPRRTWSGDDLPPLLKMTPGVMTWAPILVLALLAAMIVFVVVAA